MTSVIELMAPGIHGVPRILDTTSLTWLYLDRLVKWMMTGEGLGGPETCLM
jgi:hypothetical protein